MKDFLSRFGFHTTPFTREIRVEHHLPLSLFEEAHAALLRTLADRMSAALIAPAGTGKTALLRRLVSHLPEARYRVHYVKVTSLSRRDMCREIAAAVGAPPAGTYPNLVRRLQDHFTGLSETDGLRPVLLLDEAHDLRVEVLGMLRIVTNFEMDSRLVLSVVLAGQPALKTLLRRDDLESVTHRLAHVAVLRPLSREESKTYIEHRISVAGGSAFPFDSAALDAVFEIARGNLRATDGLCLKALQRAHDAGDSAVDPRHVVAARKELCP